MGKVGTVNMLARASLHLSASTVKRMLERPLAGPPPQTQDAAATTDTSTDADRAGLAQLARTDPANDQTAPSDDREPRSVIANYPNHVWSIDHSAPCTEFVNRRLQCRPHQRRKDEEGDREAWLGSDSRVASAERSELYWMRTIRRRPGYHGVYGETTKHASEASVLNATTPNGRMGRGDLCGQNRLGLWFRADGYDMYVADDGVPPFTIAQNRQG